MVTVAVAVPLTLPFVAVMVVVPGAIAVNSPELVIVPILVLLLLHVTVAAMWLPY